MAFDPYRAAQNFFRNIAHSQFAARLTKNGMLSLVETHAPELYDFVDTNFDRMWNWIANNLFG